MMNFDAEVVVVQAGGTDQRREGGEFVADALAQLFELRDGGVTPKDWPKLQLRDDIPRTSRVDRFPANPFGIYDSFGNLWQFCEDATDPDQTRRLLRGGSWGTSDPEELKLDGPTPKDRTADGRGIDAGFRCVLARSR